jgi:outer membrane lipoprotein-sorting protein
MFCLLFTIDGAQFSSKIKITPSGTILEVGMMRRFFALLLFFLLLAGSAAAVDFSADMVMTTKDMKTTGKIYFERNKFRMDMQSPRKMTTITRLDKRVMWSIMPEERMYMEMPLNPKNSPAVEEKMRGEIERKLVGSEKVDGHPTKKYLVTYHSGGKKEQVYQWLATDINFPVKTASVDGSWSQEYRNIKMGSQPASLFELPAGYKKFAMPGGMNFNMMRR